ncbi:MAG TPA: glycosyltransferase family 39 protein [Solirubrobacterales bacterium]|nr:glycosyltransferase family 39 protein [Solirubrobacterales bacterium]
MGAGGISVRSGRYLLPLGLIVLAGAVLRLVQIDQSLVADELWSYLEATRFDFGGMIDYVRGIQEVTPPLFTILAWMAAHVSDSAAVVRIPAVAAGILTIPAVFVIGDRTVGRGPALLAAALAALSPILIWYSIELRAYSLAVLLSSASTISLLLAVERARTAWWVAYAILVAAAMYTHYTVVYVLAAQLVWVLVFRPDARRPALIASAAAAVLFLPWVPELRDDLDAPAQQIITKLVPFGFDSFVEGTTRIVFGPPLVSLRDYYGLVPIVLFAAGIVIAAAGTVARIGAGWRSRFDARVALPVMLALAAPVGAALVSLVGDDQFIPRNLLVSVPGILLVIAALICAGPPVTRAVSGVLVVGVFAFGAVRTLEPRFQRSDFDSAAAFVDANAGSGDVVLDIPGGYVGGVNGEPLTPAAFTLDVALDKPHRVIDAVSVPAAEEAVKEAKGGRLFIVGTPFFVALGKSGLGIESAPAEQRTFSGEIPVEVQVYDIPRGAKTIP